MRLFFYVFALMLLAGCRTPVLFESVLFENGQSDWKIILSPDASETEQYAAQELSSFLERVSGSTFSIISTGEVPSAKGIVIGSLQTSSAVRDRAVDLGLNRGGDQKTAVYRLGDNLYLAGTTPRGVMHAVYVFLQKELGCRWFWPETEADGEFIPAMNRYVLPDLAFNYEPDIRYRGYHFLNGTNYQLEQWLARNFGNIIRHGTAGGAERMAQRRKLGYYLYISGHNVDPTSGIARLEDIDQAMQEHPLWFAQIDGKPHKEHFCWNNAEVEDMLVQNVLKMIDTLPGIEILGFYPSDTQSYCTCAICRQSDYSTNWFSLVRRLSDRIGEVHPQMRFTSIAYQGYMPYPKCDMSGYEFIEYALYERCYVHDLGSGCPVNERAFGTWKKWLDSDIPTGIYGYEFDIFVPSMMVPIYSMLSDQMRFFRQNKVIAVLPEVSGTYGSNRDGIRVDARKDMRLAFYLYTQLMWNPDADPKALIHDFCQYVYPSASQEMYEYHVLMDQRWSSMKQHFSSYHNSPVRGATEFLDEDTINRVFTLFADVERAMKDNCAGEAELRSLAFERKEFARWVQYFWQNARRLILIPEGEPVACAPGLTAFWGRGGIELKSDDETSVAYYRSDGTVTVQTGSSLRFADQLKGGECRQIKLDDKLSLVLYCGNLEKVSRSALYYIPDSPLIWNNAAKLRSAFLSKGWQVDFAPVKNLDCYDIVAVKIEGDRLPPSFCSEELLSFVKNGGIAILGAEGNIQFESLFGSDEYRLNWTDFQEYDWKLRKTQYMEPGEWLTIPDDLEYSLKRLCTPTSGYEIPVGSTWRSLATMRKKNGSTAPYILEMRHGNGRIYLTSGSIGLGNDGAWMTFGSSHPESVIALFNNLAAIPR